MDHGPPPPRPAWGEAFDRFSASVVGPEMRTRFGESGVTRLPAMTREDLALAPGSRDRLAASVVYLLPGGTWPGVEENGAAWLQPWALGLQALGVGRAVPLPLMPDRHALAATLEPIVSRGLTRHHDADVVARIRADLAAHPPGPGGGIWLLGHSYGSVLAFEVACQVGAAGAIALETHLTSTGFFAPHAPAVPTVLVAENEDGYWPSTAPGTTLHKLHLPGLTHMDLVLAPPAALLRAVVRAIAGEASP